MEHIHAVHYNVRLKPDLENFRFHGDMEVTLELSDPVDRIDLDILELAVWHCRVKKDEGFVPCTFQCDPAREALTIRLPQEMRGKLVLRIRYMGLINNRMAGFYRSKHVAGGREKYIAVTQFEESDARRAFPCLDRPGAKAVFQVEMVVDDALTALSNMPVAEEVPFGKGKKRVRFHPTPRMSTYLLFFGVGDFEFIEQQNRVLVRVATMPGMKAYGDFALDFGAKALHYCETFYGIEYPLPKLDLIAIPDFAFGAMENWGAITFRENLLLHMPESTSKAGEERICEVIAHEMAHQWFGNLVTPSDWKYLWLNESFATYFGFGAVHHYYPHWGIWEQFLQTQTERALERDALLETFPIEIPGGDHVVINTSTAPIIYNKGGSVLRQIEGYLGEEDFQRGLQAYLKAHEYGNAASHHLWEAFETISAKPIAKIMKSWVEQEGYPLLQVKREGNELVLNQKRFSYLPHESDQVWLVPVTVKLFSGDGTCESITTLLTAPKGRIPLPDGVTAYKVNDAQRGFYRVKYGDEANLQKLGEKIITGTLGPEDRWGLQGDLYALVQSGKAAMDDYLDFLSHYRDEAGALPLTGIAENLLHAYLVLDGPGKERTAATGKSLFEKVLSRIGFEPDPGEEHTISVLRDRLIWHAVLYGSKDVLDFALDRFRELKRGITIHPDIQKSVLQAGAFNGDRDDLSWFIKRLETSESEHDRMNLLVALGGFREKAILSEIQQYILDAVPNRNKFVPVAALAANPHAIPHMWDWFTSKLEALEAFHPVHYERVVASVVPICGLGREKDVMDFFTDYMAQKPTARDVIKLSLERLKINAGLRAR